MVVVRAKVTYQQHRLNIKKSSQQAKRGARWVQYISREHCMASPACYTMGSLGSRGDLYEKAAISINRLPVEIQNLPGVSVVWRLVYPFTPIKKIDIDGHTRPRSLWCDLSHVNAEAPYKTTTASRTASTRTALEYWWQAISFSLERVAPEAKEQTWKDMGKLGRFLTNVKKKHDSRQK